ncbi:hypothetical protein R6Q59_003256 [Mikania micrantha]|uniref:ARID domain-containing protein n=1 Tax=Mikania micrantha TaxID=192012 RepID=A0A5N6MJL5_9ASTR|nr:hypothetical protein E3N88_29708 [Mikania micrantha]
MMNDYLPVPDDNELRPTEFSSLSAGKSPSGTVSACFSGNSTAETLKEEDGFYENLKKLHESSGLSLFFNSRDTTLDLHQLYKNVTQRGGYHEVTKDGEWVDVACSVSSGSWTPSQLEKIYASVLHRFEQIYHYRSPKNPNKPPKRTYTPLDVVVPDLNSFTRKRKHDDGFYGAQHFREGGFSFKKNEQIYGFQKSFPVPMVEKRKRMFKTTPDEVKETSKDPRVPLGSRNCHQMFIKTEIGRLKSIDGNISSAQLESMNEVWKHLSHKDKRRYIKASKKDNERYAREMAAIEEHKRKQRNQLRKTTKNAIKASSTNLINHETHSQETSSGGSHVERDSDYHVSLQAEDGDESALAWNESSVQMAVGLMNNARPCDPNFQIEWDEDGYGELIDMDPM